MRGSFCHRALLGNCKLDQWAVETGCVVDSCDCEWRRYDASARLDRLHMAPDTYHTTYQLPFMVCSLPIVHARWGDGDDGRLC